MFNKNIKSSHRKSLFILLPLLLIAVFLASYSFFKYQNTSGASIPQATIAGELEKPLSKESSNGVSFIQQGTAFTVDSSASSASGSLPTLKFKPSAEAMVVAYIGQDAIKLGKIPVNSLGIAQGEVLVPKNLPYGLYTLSVIGTSETGEAMSLHQNMYVYKTKSDLDGNGQPDKDQKCGVLIPASNQDADEDGIDDACDGVISKEYRN